MSPRVRPSWAGLGRASTCREARRAACWQLRRPANCPRLGVSRRGRDARCDPRHVASPKSPAQKQNKKEGKG